MKLFKSKKLSKRDATDVETEVALAYAETAGHEGIRDHHKKGVSEGYRAEVCDCGKILLAHHHFVRCQVDECPFKSREYKGSLLDMLKDSLEKSNEQ